MNDELRRLYRSWDDERIYQTARLIVAALIAKIEDSKQLDKDAEAELNAAVTSFKKSFA